MSDEIKPDTRRGHWWGIVCPRTLHDKSWISQLVSWVAGVTALLLGVALTFLHALTMPLLIALVLVVHLTRGDARTRATRLQVSRFSPVTRTA